MPKRCFIAGCYTGVKGKENISATFFSVPSGHFEDWKRLIPKDGLVKNSHLCYRHFDDADIIKGRTIGGRWYSLQWRLRTGALPKYFLGCYFL